MSVFPSSQRSRRVGVALLLIAIAVVGISLVYARPRRAPKDDKAMTATVASALQAPSSNPAEVELIDLRLSGFEPHEITRPAGRFLLGVNNRTGLTDLSLVLANESGRSASSKRLSKVKTWREVLDLHPGRYVLREATHRDWLCRITITGR
jgi:hypothetical protein